MRYIHSFPTFAVLQLIMTMFIYQLRPSAGYHVWNSVHRTTRRLLHTRFATNNNNDVKKIVFLGTPDVAAISLQLLHAASLTSANPLEIPPPPSSSSTTFQIVSVVTQPPAPAGRNKKLTPSPVQLAAEALGIPVLTPETAKGDLPRLGLLYSPLHHSHIPEFIVFHAKDPDFLTALEALAPDLCVTAAYGNYLPKRFLAIPKYGTVNIHPSLLPKYRGAAPVQRCLEQGDAVSGVTVLFTVTKMDAGPIIAQHEVKLTGDEKADAFLSDMFQEGSRLLISRLPALLDGSVSPSLPSSVVAQDETLATAADKLSPLDARVDLSVLTARQVNNKCRGLAIWPGLWTTIQIVSDSDNGSGSGSGSGSDNNAVSEDKWLTAEVQRIKIITTVVLDEATTTSTRGTSNSNQEITVVKQGKMDVLRLVCCDGSVLGITELQPPGKKVMAARDFINGLRGKWTMRWTVPPLPSQI